MNRPVVAEDNELRKKKSIEKHMSRIDLNHKAKYVAKIKKQRSQHNFAISMILTKLK